MNCDDCGKPCGIQICTGCFGKAQSESLVPGLKKAIKILESREHTAQILTYDEVYLAAFHDLKIFLKAELYRQENPDKASHTTTANW